MYLICKNQVQYSTNILWTKCLLNWEGMICIESLYYFYLYQCFRVEKLEESTCRVIFTSNSQFGEMGYETF